MHISRSLLALCEIQPKYSLIMPLVGGLNANFLGEEMFRHLFDVFLMQIMIKEEDRLASVIAHIDEEVAIVPRGSYVKTPHGTVLKNRSFEGLSVTESGKLHNYFHFREPIRLAEKSLLEKADLDKSIDFLDPISEDIPRGGSWSLKFERGSGLVCIQSTLWPGLAFFHVPHSQKFGYVYFGTGEKNKDLPFLL